MWVRVSWLGLLGATACQFDRPPNIGEIDARIIDAAPACVADTIDCDDALDVYTDCSPTGTIDRQIQCPLGCAPDQEKCLDLDPHNGLAMYLDVAASGPDLRLTGNSIIDTKNGTILVEGRSIATPTWLVPGTDLRVFAVRSLMLEGVTVIQTHPSSPALAFVSDGNISLTGLLDISALGSTPGPGGRSGYDIQDPSPCNGSANDDTQPGGGGAGGAGGVTVGGRGGEAIGHPGAFGGAAVAEPDPFEGGCAGGYILNGANQHAMGGGGGGALHLASRTRIDLVDGAVIDASGGGGLHGDANTAGSGGGAGGRLLLEAPQIVLRGGTVAVSTKGGSGAGAGISAAHNGVDGGYGPMPAPGGPSSVQAIGGFGGIGVAPPGEGAAAGSSSTDAGGGGGSAGTTAFFTSAGVIAPQDGAALRTHYTQARLLTRTIP